MKISVVIASYNGEKYIEDQVLSILSQTIKPNEIILSDDCSSDNTIDKFKTICDKFNLEFKVISNESNLGFSKNFEKAMLKTDGDLVFISDQDDVWFNNKIEVVIESFTQRPDLFLTINDCVFSDQNLISEGVKKSIQVVKTTGDISNFIAGCCSVYNASYNDLIFPIPHHLMVYDSWLHFIGRTLKNSHFIDTPLQYYRRHNNNVSVVTFNKTEYFKRGLLKKILHFNSRISRIEYLETELNGLNLIKERLYKFKNSNFTAGNFLSIQMDNVNSSIELNRLRIDILNKNYLIRSLAVFKAILTNKDFRNLRFRSILMHFF